MDLKAKSYIGLIVTLGAASLVYGLGHQEASNGARFLFCLLLAVPASCLKICLPGVTGTMSVLFLFLLGGVVELNLAEALLMGAISSAAQSFWHAKTTPRPVHVLFSIATIEISVTASYFAYRAIPGVSSLLPLLFAASVLFLTNTFPVAAVIGLTERKSVFQVWRSSYFWYLPYYLAGAGIVGTFHFANSMLGWQAGVLVLPLVYVIYRSYHLYLNQLQSERKRVDEERAHAIEVEKLHARAVDALATATSAVARLDAVFRASPVAILTMDRDSVVTGWNEQAEQIFGWSSEEVLGRILPVPAGCSDEIVSGLAVRTLQSGAIAGEEMKQWRKNGTVFDAAVWTAPLRDASDITGTVVTVADVSGRMRLEEQLRLSQKMEAVGRLAGGVAHDFNNLLTIINGYSSLLVDSVSGDPAAVSQAEEILGAGTRAAELVSQLLSFSRRQIIKPKPFDTNVFVRDVQRLLERVIGEHIELCIVLSEDAGWVHADRNQMEGVLLNLSTNARDAMPGGGTLTIETGRLDILPGQTVQGVDLEPGSWVRLTIRDTGHGMDAVTRQHLFEPFYTTKARGKGTGLGLSSAYGSVEQNRGRIVVSSEPGQGTEFRIFLPRIEQPDHVTASAPAPQEFVRGTETILLVEDESAVRQMLREALTKAGHRVWEAGNGSEALRECASQIDKIDLVVTDLVMPVMNGLKLAEELRKLRPDLKVIFMSGHSDEVIQSQGSTAAALEFLQKPFVPQLLVRRVRELLEQSPADTPAEWQARIQSHGTV